MANSLLLFLFSFFLSFFLSVLFGVVHAPFACQRWVLPHRLAQCDYVNIIDLFLNISICGLLNHTKCWKCPPLAGIHDHRDICATHPLYHRLYFVPSNARLLSDAASVHWRHELDECRKCFHAYIHDKGGCFSIYCDSTVHTLLNLFG